MFSCCKLWVTCEETDNKQSYSTKLSCTWVDSQDGVYTGDEVAMNSFTTTWRRMVLLLYRQLLGWESIPFTWLMLSIKTCNDPPVAVKAENHKEQENNSPKTKKNFAGCYTKVNPFTWMTAVSEVWANSLVVENGIAQLYISHGRLYNNMS